MKFHSTLSLEAPPYVREEPDFSVPDGQVFLAAGDPEDLDDWSDDESFEYPEIDEHDYVPRVHAVDWDYVSPNAPGEEFSESASITSRASSVEDVSTSLSQATTVLYEDWISGTVPVSIVEDVSPSADVSHNDALTPEDDVLSTDVPSAEDDPANSCHIVST